jgi:hypothetical protein
MINKRSEESVQGGQGIGKQYDAGHEPSKGTDRKEFTFAGPGYQPEGASGSHGHPKAHYQSSDRTLQTCRVSDKSSGSVPVAKYPYQGECEDRGHPAFEQVCVLEEEQVAERALNAEPGALGDVTHHQSDSQAYYLFAVHIGLKQVS